MSSETFAQSNSITNLPQTRNSTPATSSVTGLSPATTQEQMFNYLVQAFQAAMVEEASTLLSQNPSNPGNGLATSLPGLGVNASLPNLSTNQWLSMSLLNENPSSLAPQTTSSLAPQVVGQPTSTSGSTTGSIPELVAQASAKYGVPNALISSVIQQESGFDPGAVSSAGAVGLMQLMPSTWQSYQVTDPLNPAQNIDAGTHYLSDLLNLFHGNQVKALAAYNAGPAAVSHYGGVPPYPETVQYVKDILGRLNTPQVNG